MDTISLFEQLAHTVHHRHEKNQLINFLPIDLQAAFLHSNAQLLRKNLSQSPTADFADAKTVVQG